jgi:hypothetical protein
MSSLKKGSDVNDLFLESDLHISSRDMKILKQRVLDQSPDLGPYFEFLEEIGAFESRKVRAKVFSEEFSL